MIKLIIWDLDGILWSGTLAEEGVQIINQEVIDFIRDTESKGIIHSICSKNEFEFAKKQLENLGLFDLFVFPSIEYAAKGPRIKNIINNCQLRPVDVLFVDDNIVNTNEAKYYLPDIQIENSTDFTKTFLYEPSKSRTNQYKILEKKSLDRDNIDFLKDSDICITITDENECILFHDRIVELVNRSNVLNFTQSRMTVDFTENNITPYHHFNIPRKNYAVFAWDKYGYYGLIGYFSSWDHETTEHFVFSCRILNMGIENFCSKYIKDKLGWIQNYSIDTSKNYDYIKLKDYKNVKNFIEEQEQIIPRYKEPIANINSGICLSYILWALTGISHKLTYEIFTLESLKDETIKSQPDLIIFSVFSEMDLSNYTNHSGEYFTQCIKKFSDLVKLYNKKVLLLIPKIDDPIDPLMAHLHSEFISIIDNNYFTAHYVKSSHKDFRHYNRKGLYDMSQYIRYWVEKSLQEESLSV